MVFAGLKSPLSLSVSQIVTHAFPQLKMVGPGSQALYNAPRA